MRKRRLGRVCLLLAALLAAGAGSLYASSLIRSLIESADRPQLENMARMRSIAVWGVDTETLRSELLALYPEDADASVAGNAEESAGTGDTENPPSGGTGEGEKKEAYTMEITQARRMEKTGSLVTLLGNIQALVMPSGKGPEEGKNLSADAVIVDPDHTQFSAQGGAQYEDKAPDAPVQSMKGDIITLDWNRSLLTISGGTTRSERKNSADETVEFYTTGDTITYDTSRGLILFDHGYITNNPKNAYSSLSARRLAIIDTGDMFLESATLNIGRVPVLWLPFLFFPGSRMLGNPAIGYESSRGWFVNTSFELFGTYPSVGASGSSSSFTRFLQGEEDSAGPKVYDGPIRRSLQSGEQLSPFEKWAWDSGSWAVLFADAYQNTGLMMGLATEDNFWDKHLAFAFDGRVAVTENGKDEVTSYGYYPKTRYAVEDEFKLTFTGVDVDITAPLYSDPKVKRTYFNRLTTFSLDELWNTEWPTDYTSEVTSYTMSASAAIDLGTWFSSPWLSTFSISPAEASATYTWRKEGSGDEYVYSLDSVVLPNVGLSLGGTVFNFTEDGGKAEATQTEAEKAEEALIEKEATEITGDDAVNEMLKTAYRAKKAEEKDWGSRSAKLTWKANGSYKQTGSSEDSEFDWQDTRYQYGKASGSVDLSVVADPRWFAFTQDVAPTFTYTYDAAKSTRETQSTTLKGTTTASIPILGLSYTLSAKLWSYTEKTTYDSSTDTESTSSTEDAFAFTSDYVTTHQISFSKDFALGDGTLTPSATWILPPLTETITPALRWKRGPWTLTGSWKFIQHDEDGPIERDLITNTVAFDTDWLTFSVTGTYQQDDWESDASFWAPFKSNGAAALKGFGFTFSGSYDYAYTSSKGDRYFNSLTAGAAWGPFSTTYTWNGEAENLERYTWVSKIDLSGWKIRWWKRRCALTLGVDAKLTVNYQNRYATNLTFSMNAGFSIADFLDINLSFSSTNSSFFTYYDGDEYSWNAMWEDLGRSFDIFGGGIKKTNFDLSGMSLELVHHMDDWTLNCKYSGSVVLSDNTYEWVPVVTVFLQWKTIPELKVDENWTRENGSSLWTETSSVYSD